MPSPARLTRDILWLVLAAAAATAPVFLFAEGFGVEHVLRVAASNGVCMVLCAGLLVLLRRGRVELVALTLVLGLLALVAALAWTNDEPVHTNVVNFVFVTVLAGVLLPRRLLIGVGLTGASVLCAIAWKQGVGPDGPDLLEARLEPVAQFLPTYLVILLVLWLRAGGRSEPQPRTQPEASSNAFEGK